MIKMKDLIQEGRNIQETFKKNVSENINETTPNNSNWIKPDASAAIIRRLKSENDELLEMMKEIMRPYGIYDEAISSTSTQNKGAYANEFIKLGDKIRKVIAKYK
jgi:hypothetical protein